MFSLLGWPLFLLWAIFLVPMIPVMSGRWLRLRAAGRTVMDWPLVSVIVPARNEGTKVEAGLRSHLSSDYPNLEIVAIDDRSTDATGRVMDRLALEDPRLRVVHITELPSGWLGKNHAMQTAGHSARGDWLIFTDGDVLFQPDTIRLAVAYALTGGSRLPSQVALNTEAATPPIDFLCLIPRITGGGYFERVLCAFFGFILLASVQPFMVASRWKFAYCGVGAFNMIRRSAWQAVGGHIRIRLDILDDVHLGKLMKNTGQRCELLLAGEAVCVRWQDSLWGVIRGLEKNAFASVNYSLIGLTFASLLLVTCVFGPYLGVVLGHGSTRLPFLLSALFVHFMFAWQAELFGAGWSVTWGFPAGCVLFLVAYWRSAWITLRQRGVRWRDTFYPLQDLRVNRLNV